MGSALVLLRTKGVALCYHKFAEFKSLPKDQQDELVEWNKANGRGKGDKGGGKNGKGGKQSPGGSPCNDPTKKLKSMISEMEARQTKMYEAMADVQTTSIAAMQATTASPTPSPRGVTVGAANAALGVTPPEVMIERANVAMLKLTGILKSKEKKA